MQSILFTVYSGTFFAILRIHWEAETTDYSGTLHQDSAMSGEDRPAVHHSRTASTQPSEVSWQPRDWLCYTEPQQNCWNTKRDVYRFIKAFTVFYKLQRSQTELYRDRERLSLCCKFKLVYILQKRYSTVYTERLPLIVSVCHL